MTIKTPQLGRLESFSEDTGTGWIRTDEGLLLLVTRAALGMSPIPGRRLRVTAIGAGSATNLEATAVEIWIDEHAPPLGPSAQFLEAAATALGCAQQFASQTVPAAVASAFNGRTADLAAWHALLTAIGTTDERRAQLLASARPTARLVARTTEPTGGASKIGGEPDLPPSFCWPEFRGVPHTFLAQVAIDQLSTALRESLNLQTGMLSFFYEVKSSTWGNEEGDEAAIHVVWSPDTADLQQHPAPSGSLRLPEISIALYDDLTVPSSTEMYFDVPEAELESWAMANVPLLTAVELHADRHGKSLGQVGGCARHRQPAPGFPSTVVLLFQLDADEELSFGDGGQLLVWIDEADLRAHRFDRAWHQVESA